MFPEEVYSAEETQHTASETGQAQFVQFVQENYRCIVLVIVITLKSQCEAEGTMPRCCSWDRWNYCSRMPQHGPDSVHSWLVAGACAFSSFFAMAGRRSAGFLFVATLETFQVNRTEGSWPIMAMGAVVYLAGFITGPLAHRFNARPVIIAGAVISAAGAILSFFATSIGFMTLTLGVIHAIGSGMVFIVAPTIISEHFVKNKGLAMGVNFAGVTAGLFVFPKLLEYLTATYGLRGALLIFGAVIMNGLAFSLFPRTPAWRKASRGKNELAAQFPSKAIGDNGTNELRHALTVFKSPVFYLIIYSFNAYCFGYECYMSLFVDFACDRGVTLSTAVTVMSAGAISEIFGRFTLPAAGDRGLLSIKTAVVLTLAAEAVTFLVLPLLRSQGLIFTVAIVIAFIIGTAMVIFPVTLASYFGYEKMSVSFGIVVGSAGMLSFVKPSLIGHFRDRVGAYDWLFVICGLLNGVGAALWIVVLALERSRSKKELINNESATQETIITTNCSNSFLHEFPR
ncbi:monocarboxylate transporter 13-like isoform X2 [Dermacentor albipictus]|uniref:monocarboxylate transporter 13-like isoform X2 n=1 Tax=Dermacentor albipictus TaxID=60249 RepID=UPI0038FCB050